MDTLSPEFEIWPKILGGGLDRPGSLGTRWLGVGWGWLPIFVCRVGVGWLFRRGEWLVGQVDTVSIGSAVPFFGSLCRS